MESDQLLVQLQSTIDNLAATTRDITLRINTDIKDLYEKVNTLRENVVRIQTTELSDKDVAKRLEASIESLQIMVAKLNDLVLSKEEVASITNGIESLNLFMAGELARQSKESEDEKRNYRATILKILSGALGGGAATAGIMQLIKMLASAGS